MHPTPTRSGMPGSISKGIITRRSKFFIAHRLSFYDEAILLTLVSVAARPLHVPMLVTKKASVNPFWDASSILLLRLSRKQREGVLCLYSMRWPADGQVLVRQVMHQFTGSGGVKGLVRLGVQFEQATFSFEAHATTRTSSDCATTLSLEPILHQKINYQSSMWPT